ncbi:MAG: TIGR04283 family arsenosugar biosynthesis glycosyltransferase [Pelagimonas sp.]|jgi:rSAM/selenodomain-associated transferase 2|nr:TIGR04283 family arsenosugar biosynthesis glycosyltransferase [Pelagimonas sp.]
MRAPISVIIPTLNAEATLPCCLNALSEGLSAGLIRELIVSDGGSEDQTRAIAEAAGAVMIQGAPSRGGQLGRGCAKAGGDWLLVLHADTELEEGWSRPATQALENPGAYYGQLRFDTRGPMPAWVAGWANLRSRLFGLPYGDQGLLVDRATYEMAGGYADIPLMEDVALARALRGKLRPLGARAITSAAKYRQAGWLRRGARNLMILMRYYLGTDPERLARSYRK